MRFHRLFRRATSGAFALIAAGMLTGCRESTAPAPVSLNVWTGTPAGDPVLFDGGTILFTAPAGGFVALDPATGVQRFQLTPPAGVSALLFERYVTAGTLAELRAPTAPNAQRTTSVAYDLRDGSVVGTFQDQPGAQRVLGVVGGLVVRALDDSVLVANAIGTLAERWRSTVPALGCPSFCGGMVAIDTVGGELLLARLGQQTAALVRVNALGIVSTVPTARQTFVSGAPVQYGARTAPTAPVVVATDRALTLIDPLTGATRYRVPYTTVRPPGYFSLATRFHLTRDGRWLTTVFLDSAGTASAPSREYVLQTADGSRIRERAFNETTGLELFRGSCGTSGLVRVLNDLRVERVDVATGRAVVSDPVTALSVLYTRTLTSGFVPSLATTSATHLVGYNRLAQPSVVGVPCTL